jgi:hypothetical protein
MKICLKKTHHLKHVSSRRIHAGPEVVVRGNNEVLQLPVGVRVQAFVIADLLVANAWG